MMLSDLELMRIRLSVLFTHDPEGRLLFVSEPGKAVAVAPRMYLGRTRVGNVWRLRADLPEELIGELDSLCADEPMLNHRLNDSPCFVERYIRLLEKHAPVERVSTGPAYRFPPTLVSSGRAFVITESDAEMLRGGFEALIEELIVWQPFVVLTEAARVVSVCRSVRITSEAHEAGVETLPDFRGKGYATDAVSEWAKRVRALDAIPLYSTSWENNASRGVARKLSLECYGADFQIT